MIDRLELGQLWQSILRTDPIGLFGRGAEILMDRPNVGDDLPQPGFVGPSYRPGGVLFLGKNPGNGPSNPKKLNNLEIRHIRALRDLKNATPTSLPRSFEALMESLVPIMSAWYLVRNYVRPIISEAAMDLDSVAYLNLFKWRSQKEPSPFMFRQSWREQTGKQYDLLHPRFVVALGVGTFGKFKDVSSASDTTGVTVFRLERSRNDRQPPPPETLQLMPEIAKEIRDRYRDR